MQGVLGGRPEGSGRRVQGGRPRPHAPWLCPETKLLHYQGPCVSSQMSLLLSVIQPRFYEHKFLICSPYPKGPFQRAPPASTSGCGPDPPSDREQGH